MTDNNLETKEQEVETADCVEQNCFQRAYVPAASIYETEDQVVVLADMPGVDQSSVEIILEKNELTIRGSVKPFQPEGYTLAYHEYEAKEYRRSFMLSDEIDRNHIEASMKDGVLRLELTKAPEHKARKIAVKAG